MLVVGNDFGNLTMPDGHVLPKQHPGGRADVLIQPSSNRRQNQHTQYPFHPATALRAENVTRIVGSALSHAS
jgi:hypothetical protein